VVVVVDRRAGAGCSRSPSARLPFRLLRWGPDLPQPVVLILSAVPAPPLRRVVLLRPPFDAQPSKS